MNPFKPTIDTASTFEEAPRDNVRRRTRTAFAFLNIALLAPATWFAMTLIVIWTHPKAGDNLKSAPVLSRSQRLQKSIFPGLMAIAFGGTLLSVQRFKPKDESSSAATDSNA